MSAKNEEKQGGQEEDTDAWESTCPAEWERCRCDLPGCNSCTAERLAVVGSDQSFMDAAALEDEMAGLLYPSDEDLLMDHSEPTPQEEAMGKILLFELFNSGSDTECPMPYHVEPAPGRNGYLLFIYWFHRAISDSTIDGRTAFSQASACVVLRFACQFSRDPSILTLDGPSEKVMSQIQNSMREGNACYDSMDHSNDTSTELGPPQAIQLCQDQGLKLLQQRDIYQQWAQILTRYILHLTPGQILIICRWKPYKVLSVVCTADPNAVCLYDSQLHNTYTQVMRGALLFHSIKSLPLITMMISRLEEYILKFNGKCSLWLLEL